MGSKRILRSILSVSGIVIIAKTIGFIKQMVSASYFGATLQTDMIALSQGLVQNVDYMIVQSLLTAFVPTYLRVKAEDEKEASIFTSNAIVLCLIITVLISAIILLFGNGITVILAPSYSAEQHVQLAKYIRIMSFSVIFIVQMAVFNALLKSNEKFIPGEFISINQSVIYIVLIFAVGGLLGADTLVISFYAYAVLNLIFLMICSRKVLSFKTRSFWQDKNVHSLVKMMGPLIVGYAMVFVNQQVDKIIVSGLGDGTITAMHYASVLSNFVTAFIGSICSVLFTFVSKHISEKNDNEAAKLVSDSVVQMATVLIPISVISIMNSKDLVTIAFGRGEFDSKAILSCSLALIGYSAMFVPFVFREMFSRFQYGYSDSKKPMINSVISIVVNIVLSIVLSIKFGVLGVTLATSISVLICAILNVLSSKRLNRCIALGTQYKNIALWVAGIAICVFVSLTGKHYLSNTSPLLRFALITVVCFMIYTPIVYKIIKPLIIAVRKH